MEAHTSMLAFESPLMLALMALSSSAVWLLLWRRSRAPYMLLMLAGWLGLCLYWSMLAISAGPAPVLPRGDIAVAVRVLGVVVALVIVAGKILLLRQMWRNGRRDST